MIALDLTPDSDNVIDAFSFQIDGVWKHSFLSNGFREPDGSFVEREYQAAKAVWTDDAARILLCPIPFGPGGAKKLGRAAASWYDWDLIAYPIMKLLVLKKFLDHPELAAKLLATGNARLVEGNSWHDNTWGDCHCGKAGHPECQQSGANELGRILMNVREALAQLPSSNP